MGRPECAVDKCDESSLNFMPNRPECAVDKCDESNPSFMPNHPECEVECAVVSCNGSSLNFMPNHPDCVFKGEEEEEATKCEVKLTEISTTQCEIKEEYQAKTCGDCP